MKSRLFYLILCGLVLAGIVHIAIVLMVPFFGDRDAARRIATKAPLNQFVDFDQSGKEILPDGDPFFRMASCRFDLSQAGIAIEAAETGIFWSTAVFNKRGRVIYSLSKRSTIGDRLSMIVVNPIQMARIRQFDPGTLEQSIVVETSETDGFVVMRVLERDESLSSEVEAFVDSLSCVPYEQ